MLAYNIGKFGIAKNEGRNGVTLFSAKKPHRIPQPMYTPRVRPKTCLDKHLSPLTQEHLNCLDEKGFCIIEGVLNNDQCARAVEHFRDFLCGIGSGITREAMQEGKVPLSSLPYNLHGIITYPPAVGDEVMPVRYSKEVNNVFADLWGVNPEDLITSEDRACYMPKVPEGGNPRKDTSWLHIDQAKNMPGLQCYQGFVTLLDVSDKGGSLVVIPGSHAHHGHLTSEANKNKNTNADSIRFVTMTPELLTWLKNTYHMEPMVVRPLKAGSMVLWDSRTVHCNRTTQAEERMVIYTCQVPRVWGETAKRKQMEKKRKAFVEARVTSHWPQYIKVFGKLPHTYGAPLKEYDKKYTDDDLVAKRHFESFNSLLGDDVMENTRLVRLAGFVSVADYKEHTKKFTTPTIVTEKNQKKRKAETDVNPVNKKQKS